METNTSKALLVVEQQSIESFSQKERIEAVEKTQRETAKRVDALEKQLRCLRRRLRKLALQRAHALT